MPEIDVSEDQLAYLEDLRATLEAEVPYGHVRHRDALQYLIDRREDDVDADLRDALADGDEDEATGTPAAEDDESATGSATDSSSGPDTEANADASADTSTGAATEAATEATTETTSTSTSTPTPTPTSASGDDRLQAMMSLLDTHDEHWRESAAEDARYEVTLPDGRVEHARTKDDVRSLLFKHYR